MTRAAAVVASAIVLGCTGRAPAASEAPAEVRSTPPAPAKASTEDRSKSPDPTTEEQEGHRDWPGTLTFPAPWTQLDLVAQLGRRRLLVAGNRFTTSADGLGSRHGALAWVDATGAVTRELEIPGADEIYGMAVSHSGAIALAGYSQGDGGYLVALDRDGNTEWRVSLGAAQVARGITFASDGDVIACGGWGGGSWVERRTSSGAVRWRTVIAEDADGFSFGVAISPSGEIAAAGGRGATVVARLGPDGELRWTRALALGSDSSSAGGVAIDAVGAVLVAGRTSQPVPGVDAGGGDDAFVARLDKTGEVAWVRAVATSGLDYANAVALDHGGDAVVAGARGVGSGGAGSGFVARFDRDGALVWTADVDWPGIETLTHVALDAGSAYVVGSFQVDAFGFQRSGFLAKLDREGAVQ